MRTTKTVVLFGDLKVLNALSLSWVAGQFENATAKIVEGNKNTASRVQDAAPGPFQRERLPWFPVIRTHLNVFQCGPHLLFRCISVLMNKKTACKRWYHIQVRSADNLSSPPKSDIFGIHSWFREELKQPLDFEHKTYSEAFLWTRPYWLFLLRFCNCICPSQAD